MKQNKRGQLIEQIVEKMTAALIGSNALIEEEYRAMAPDLRFDGVDHVLKDLSQEDWLGGVVLHYEHNGRRRIMVMEFEDMVQELAGSYDCQMDYASMAELRAIQSHSNVIEGFRDFRRGLHAYWDSRRRERSDPDAPVSDLAVSESPD